MKHATLPLLFVSLLGVVSCGGDDGGRASTAEEGSEFCDLAAEAEELGDEVDAAGDPDELEDAVKAAMEAAEAAAAEAPEDIVDLLEDNVEFQRSAMELLEDNDWDPVAAAATAEGQELFGDEDAQADLEEAREYLEDKCGIENDADDPDPTGTPTDTGAPTDTGSGGPSVDLPDGEAGYLRFVELYSIGAGVEVTDEQQACLVDEMSGSVTVEQLERVIGGEVDEDAQIAVGLAFISCGVIEG